MWPTAALMSVPMACIRLRSVPKSLMAMLARVPDSMWSMRWPSGWPTVAAMPGMDARVALTSAMNSSLLRPPRLKLTSISALLVACECSSSSPRPVRRDVLLTSGIFSSSRSMALPSSLLTSSDTPGCVTADMVSEPSLNSGRKLRPMRANSTTATTSSAAVTPSTARR